MLTEQVCRPLSGTVIKWPSVEPYKQQIDTKKKRKKTGWRQQTVRSDVWYRNMLLILKDKRLSWEWWSWRGWDCVSLGERELPGGTETGRRFQRWQNGRCKDGGTVQWREALRWRQMTCSVDTSDLSCCHSVNFGHVNIHICWTYFLFRFNSFFFLTYPKSTHWWFICLSMWNFFFCHSKT